MVKSVLKSPLPIEMSSDSPATEEDEYFQQMSCLIFSVALVLLQL